MEYFPFKNGYFTKCQVVSEHSYLSTFSLTFASQQMSSRFSRFQDFGAAQAPHIKVAVKIRGEQHDAKRNLLTALGIVCILFTNTKATTTLEDRGRRDRKIFKSACGDKSPQWTSAKTPGRGCSRDIAASNRAVLPVRAGPLRAFVFSKSNRKEEFWLKKN
jgi:hypothetical protein